MILLVGVYLLAALTATSSLTTGELATPDLIMVSSLEPYSSTDPSLLLTFSFKPGKSTSSDLIMSLYPPMSRIFQYFPRHITFSVPYTCPFKCTLSSNYIYIPITPLSRFFSSVYFAVRIFIVSSTFPLFYRPEYFCPTSSLV